MTSNRLFSTTWVVLGALTLSGLLRVQGQIVAPLPNPKLSVGGTVWAIAVQADGKVIIGGNFDRVNGVDRMNIARLNPDGSLDTTWNPGVEDPTNIQAYTGVSAITVAGTNIYIGGTFSRAGRLDRANIARLSMTGNGAADPIWNPSADGDVYAIAVSGSNVFVGGAFSHIGGLIRHGIAKLGAGGTGGAAAAWNPNPSGNPYLDVDSLAVIGTNLFVGGDFTIMGGQFRYDLAKLATDGIGLADPNWNPNPDSSIYTIVATNNNLYVGGAFTSIGGQARNLLAKVSAGGTGDADPLWNPNPNGSPDPNYPGAGIYSLLLKDGYVYVAGYFANAGSMTQMYVAKFSADDSGSADTSWHPKVGSSYGYGVEAIAAVGTNVCIGGDFNRVGGDISLGFAEINTATGGLIPATAQVEWPSPDVQAIAVQPGGKIIIGGSFLAVDGSPRGNLARFNSDGSLDANWNPDVDGRVSSICVGTNGIFIGGIFDQVGGQNRTNIAKVSLTGAGAVDPDWNPGANGEVKALVSWGTNVFAGGDFTNVGGLDRRYLAKLSAEGTGAVDLLWNPNPNSEVNALAVSGTNLFVGGMFTNIGSLERPYVAKVITGGLGSVNAQWKPLSDLYFGSYYGYGVQSIAVDGDSVYISGGDIWWRATSNYYYHYRTAKLAMFGSGQPDLSWDPKILTGDLYSGYSSDCCIAAASTNVYVGGAFREAGGLERTNLVEVDANGTGAVQTNWQANTVGVVTALAVEGNNLCVGGSFTAIAGEQRDGLALITTGIPRLFIRDVHLSLGSLTFQFDTVSGYTYYVETAIGLSTATMWQEGRSIAGDGTVKTVSVPIVGNGKLFVRLRVQ